MCGFVDHGVERSGTLSTTVDTVAGNSGALGRDGNH